LYKLMFCCEFFWGSHQSLLNTISKMKRP